MIPKNGVWLDVTEGNAHVLGKAKQFVNQLPYYVDVPGVGIVVEHEDFFTFVRWKKKDFSISLWFGEKFVGYLFRYGESLSTGHIFYDASMSLLTAILSEFFFEEPEKLTKVQKNFLVSIYRESEGRLFNWLSSFRSEIKTVRALVKKGLIETNLSDEELAKIDFEEFEVRIKPRWHEWVTRFCGKDGTLEGL